MRSPFTFYEVETKIRGETAATQMQINVSVSSQIPNDLRKQTGGMHAENPHQCPGTTTERQLADVMPK
jgi:hypothetical protein